MKHTIFTRCASAQPWQPCYLRRQNTRRDGDTSSQIRRMPFKMDDLCRVMPSTNGSPKQPIDTYIASLWPLLCSTQLSISFPSSRFLSSKQIALSIMQPIAGRFWTENERLEGKTGQYESAKRDRSRLAKSRVSADAKTSFIK